MWTLILQLEDVYSFHFHNGLSEKQARENQSSTINSAHYLGAYGAALSV